MLRCWCQDSKSLVMIPYEVLYDRNCRTLLYWAKLSKKKIHNVNVFRETVEKVKVICDSLKAASDRQKVFLIVSPWKKILHFVHKEKLSLLFIRPYEIIERIRPITYQLDLPSKLERDP
ncbi:reverse transcriptase [Gossypium australe]|uniref:Reverse transcriptase n=1 Tax=Gossypium australe TaxID=47621 RepID=A0A5B6VXX8_9ROSI|nr:reverse transcriptase [Gossypium australe]